MIISVNRCIVVVQDTDDTKSWAARYEHWFLYIETVKGTKF